MALNKRQYVDGQTIVTASNLNEIQDCIITLENNYVPKTRTVAGKALSSNITLSAGDVGAVPTSLTINAKALTGNITLSAADVGAVPVARTVNGKALSSNITLSAADVSAVPTTRTVNSKALSQDISLTASDVGAVPTGRTVNEKALSSDITLAASDVGAVPTGRTVNGKALSSNITLTASDVGAVPTSRTVNGKALSANITLASSDIGDDSGAGGADVKASLVALKGSLNSILPFDTEPTSGSLKGVTSGGLHTKLNNLYKLNKLYRFYIPSGTQIAANEEPTILKSWTYDDTVLVENGKIHITGSGFALIFCHVIGSCANNRMWYRVFGVNTNTQHISYGAYCTGEIFTVSQYAPNADDYIWLQFYEPLLVGGGSTGAILIYVMLL